MMFDVLITYDYDKPPTPRDYMVMSGGTRPKCNHRVVTSVATKEEGERIGQEALMEELDGLSWLLGDAVLIQIEVDEKSDRKDIYRWHDTMEAEYQSLLAEHREEYQVKVQARRAELIAMHEKDT